jgi:hypothetical protein
MTKAKVVVRKYNADGNPVGRQNANPVLDTCKYKVLFPDSVMDTFTVNIIAENMFLQVDKEGRSYSIIEEIIDHKKDGTAVSKEDGYEVTSNGIS